MCMSHPKMQELAPNQVCDILVMILYSVLFDPLFSQWIRRETKHPTLSRVKTEREREREKRGFISYSRAARGFLFCILDASCAFPVLDCKFCGTCTMKALLC